MKKTRFAAAAAVLTLLMGTAAFADPALPSFDMYDSDMVKSLTWTEGTPYYDYVCYTYDEETLPEYSYRIYACDLDMNSALLKKEGGCYFQVDPLFVGSFDAMVPYLDIACQGVSAPIVRAQFTAGDYSLTAVPAEGSELSAYEDGVAELLITTMGSNQIALIRALEVPGVRPQLTLDLADGTSASCTFVLPQETENNPFVWLHRLLTLSRYLDGEDRVQESSRLLFARNALEDRGTVLLSVQGAEWIDDLSDSVRAFPVKLEYAPDQLADQACFHFDVLNYAGAFLEGDDTVTAFDLLWYPVDENGDPVPAPDGSLTAVTSYDCRLSPGEEQTFSVTCALPESALYISAAISAFTLESGETVTVPERDLVFVFYQAVAPETTDL